jgi:hypothetical protein
MNERKLYDLIGRWLVNNKDCQKNTSSRGYIKEPSIPSKYGEESRRPDVVGVRYEITDRKPPVADFHHYFVEVKLGTDSGQLSNIVGEIERLPKHVSSTVAADSAEYYFALPEGVPLHETRDLLKEKGVGILRVDIDEKPYTIQETLEAETHEYQQRSRLSNTDMESPGNFRKKLTGEVWDNPPVLKKALDPPGFFEEVLRPAQEEYKNNRN